MTVHLPYVHTFNLPVATYVDVCENIYVRTLVRRLSQECNYMGYLLT